MKNKRPNWYHLLFYFTSYVLNIFRTWIYPSSGACDYSVELQHWSYCPTQPHRNSNTHRTKNNTTNVVIQQNSCKLLKMDILMSETCWAQKMWNKIAGDIKLVFYSSTVCIPFVFLYDTLMMVTETTETCRSIVIHDKIYFIHVHILVGKWVVHSKHRCFTSNVNFCCYRTNSLSFSFYHFYC